MLYLVEKYPLNGVSHLCSILPVLVGLFSYKQLSQGLRLLILLFVAYFVNDSFSLWLSIYKKSTFTIQNIQPLWEIALAVTIYLTYFESSLSKRLVKYGVVICITVITFSIRTDSISPVGSVVEKLFIVIIILMYLNEILREARVRNILAYSMFWVSAGLLIYLAGTFFFSLFSAYLYDDSTSNSVFDPFWNLNQLLYILFSLLASMGLWFSKYDSRNLV
ncbi:MAG: hypothetical protein JWP57_2964 [Spirosoma sp.]|nr:hypothetical protein [Spirosoma sp.]